MAVLKTISEKELNKEFGKILLEAVDEAFDTLGASIKEALYFHLETTFAIKKETIPENPAKLSDSLERIFGLGAKFVEKMIIDSVYRKTGCKPNPKWHERSFAENLEKIKIDYIKNRSGASK